MEFTIQAFVSGELIGSDLHLVSGTHTKEFTTILSHKIIQLEDEAIKKSLKELGWTPPEEESMDKFFSIGKVVAPTKEG